MYYFKFLIKILEIIKLILIIYNNKTFIEIIKLKMDSLKNLLALKKGEISSSLDLFMSEFKRVVEDKNKKIIALTLQSKVKLVKLPDIAVLWELKSNNTILKKNLKKVIKIKKENKKLRNLLKESKNSEKNILDTKNMTAFKVIALDLEEKEKILKKKDDYIGECQNKIEKLELNINALSAANDNLKEEISLLHKKNKDLVTLNSLQSETINSLKATLDSKNRSLEDLKDSFMELLNKYNDILIEVC